MTVADGLHAGHLQPTRTTFMSRRGLKYKTGGKFAHVNRSIVKAAAGHNTRESIKDFDAYPHIDCTRTHLNEYLIGPRSAVGIAEAVDELIRETGHNPDTYRLDGVRVMEVLCSLPPTFEGDQGAYFRDCVSWAGSRYGGHDNIVSAIAHHDEGAPHVHILLVPRMDGNMRGGKFADTRRNALIADQADFRAVVAGPHGLCLPAQAMADEERRALAARVVAVMMREADPATKSRGWAWIRQAIEADPEGAAAYFGEEGEKSYDFDSRKMGEVISCGLLSPLPTFSAAPSGVPERVER
ncbi:MAG: plasmid recombination protein [Gammaproteobacteria bacterium]|nr:plasmid recombination protein [Gammaproteobacteria bacterium]MBU1442800.1 plasmid recombination protein [Gammaproteobacteria bacterium]MBU2286945.1 plasmid recombination protein [Gammaproteobacteria bacterium]MBU2408840.1 plasmid recombination protein [Gammaproteobacteria bacterium]